MEASPWGRPASPRLAVLAFAATCWGAAAIAQEPTPTPPPASPPAEPAPAPAAEPAPPAVPKDRLPVPDRWRVDFPDWDRRVKGRLFNPYDLNPLKGDYPIKGTQNTFFVLTAVSDTLAEARGLPTPSDVSSENPGSEEFFGRSDSYSLIQQAIVTFDLFHGSTSYKPIDWELRFTGVGNINYLNAQERGVVKIDPTRGTDRTDRHFGIQEAFAEVKLADVSPRYDTISVRLGIQGFTSDFRGFVFSDQNLGARLFGNFANNRYQWNVVAFDHLEKDTNSGLNTLHRRNQQVGIANLYLQDFANILGYTWQFSFHYTRDRSEPLIDRNGFPVRPGLIGTPRLHEQDVYYIGWTSDGHIGRINVNHAFYQVLGHDTFDPIAGRRVDLNSQLGALELSIDKDWLRYKVSGFYQSGDADPGDDTARGFDSILDNVNFAGGPFSFFNRQSIRLTQTGVALTNRSSLLADFKSSKDEGMSEYVNPGVILANLGLHAKLTPKVTLDANANYIWFANPEALEYVLFQPNIPKAVGLDLNLGLKYRPWLNDNAVIVLGAAGFFPGDGFKAIYTSNCSQVGCGKDSKVLYQGFASLTLTY